MSSARTLLAALLVLGLFGYSVVHVLATRRAAEPPDVATIRIGHWLMHAGMREAFDEAIADYEKLHPGVRIEQIAVPLRTYAAWTRTRLIGGTAPDITGMLTLNEDLIARYFLPLTEEVDQPNPYNTGTPLEGLPWRETFVDGLLAMRALTPTSGEICGVNLQINTLRLYYNRELLRAVTGGDEPPADFAALLALGPQVEAFNQRTGRRIVPIASCGPYAQYLFNALVPSQTQRLALELSPQRNLRVFSFELATLFLRGEIGLDTPALRRALELMREVTALMPPGFTQLQRDDALFAYLQGNALMFYAGSWDYGVVVRDAAFSTGIAPLPLPSPEDPRFGPQTLGAPSEAAGLPEAMLGVVRGSRHPEIAVDFLRFLSSHRVAGRFSAESHRISAIVGAAPPPDAAELAPRLEGEIAGFPLDFQFFGSNTAYNTFHRHLHAALGPRGDVDRFVALLDQDLAPALRQDLTHHTTRLQRDLQRLDALITLHLTLPPEDPRREGWTRHAETQHLRQAERARLLPLLRP
jgi:ABC-type glycerol-3-phosphate transport system substrate-binding protein